MFVRMLISKIMSIFYSILVSLKSKSNYNSKYISMSVFLI